jgi:leucyl/phenylalanyl-tRNA--protein transferase
MAQDGLLAVGGDLTPEWLIHAYSKGIFPWFNNDYEQIRWWYPEKRAVIRPGDMRVSKSLKKFLLNSKLEIKADKNFRKVMELCASTRSMNVGTWITDNMVTAYTKLHDQNIAHSIEVYEEGIMIGGLYGISIGKIFCGESMFHLKNNASKAAFYHLNKYLLKNNYDLIDCQFVNNHLLSLGVREIDSHDFLKILDKGIKKDFQPNKWDIK